MDRIAKAIQRTVLTEIAALDLGPETPSTCCPVRLPREAARSRPVGGLGTTQGIVVQFNAS